MSNLQELIIYSCGMTDTERRGGGQRDLPQVHDPAVGQRSRLDCQHLPAGGQMKRADGFNMILLPAAGPRYMHVQRG